MKKSIKMTALAALTLTLFACKTNQALPERERQVLIQRGVDISRTVTAAMMGKLLPQMQQSGPISAIKFCSTQAVATTDSLSKQERVSISRVSHLTRNPNNTANGYELELINNYISQLKENKTLTPTLLAQQSKNTFYAPIVIQMPTCLKCHGKVGTDIGSDVHQAIQELYPNDKAVGFEQGQLRGLFKIEFAN